MHDILPTNKHKRIDSSQVKVKILHVNFQPLQMLMDNVDFSDLELQSNNSEKQQQTLQTSKRILKHKVKDS
jgi:hypothetical protein